MIFSTKNLVSVGARHRYVCLTLLALCSFPAAVWAQASMQSMPGMQMPAPQGGEIRDKPEMDGMDHSKMKGMDHSQMKSMDHGDMKGMDHSQMQGMDHGDMKGMDHEQMKGMDHGDMKGMDHGQMKGMDHGDMKGMDHSQMQGMDHGDMKGMDHGQMQGMDHGDMKGMDHGGMKGMDHGQMQGMDMGSMMKSMQGGSAPPDARDPDVYADGLALGHMPGMDMEDDVIRAQLLLDRLEVFRSSDSHGQAIDAQGWIGGDIDKLWLKVDGERAEGKLGATRTEALWNHAIATYWGLQAGVRHDFGDGPGRTWAAFGFQGLAPYWFDLQATAYVGQGGRTALRFEPEYDLLLTQRLILQPNVKVNLYGKNDRERGIGSGLSDMEAGLRLRYEFSRKFAPYVGVVYNRKFGDTARYASDAGKSASETRLVGGVRIWF
jgi:copper resistance protein B